MAQYSIKAVTQRTGVKADTLRTWERRYNAVEALRAKGGARFYSDEGLQRILLLKQGTAQGHPIRVLAAMDDASLAALVAEGQASPPPAAPTTSLVEQLLSGIEIFNLSEFERLVGLAALAYAPRELVEKVLHPVLIEVGNRWHDGKLSVAQEHAVSASLRAVLTALTRTYATPVGAPVILMTTLPGERHEFGILMLRLIAASTGAATHYLGVDLPADEIVAAARGARVKVVALSVVNADSLSTQREHLHVLLNDIGDDGPQVWIGGAKADELVKGIASPQLRVMRDMATFEKNLAALGVLQ